MIIVVGMLPMIQAPWIFRDDFASAAFSTVARNHLEFGLSRTKGTSILLANREHPENSSVYAHHPFLYPVLLSFVFRVLGTDEWVARSAAISVSLASIVLLYLLVRQTFTACIALLSSALFGLTPANLFEGRVVSLEQPALLAMIAAVLLYYRWIRTHSRSRFVALLVSLGLGMLVEWEVYYLTLLLPAHHALFIGGRWRQLTMIAAMSPLMFGVFLGHLYWAVPMQITDVWHAFLHRSGQMSAAQQLNFSGHIADYTLAQFLAVLGTHLVNLLLAPFLLLAIGGLWIVIRNMRQKDCVVSSLPLLLVAPAVMHTILFPNAVFVHECLIILYLPGLSIAAGIFLAQLLKTMRLQNPQFIIGILLLVWFVGSSIHRTAELYDDQSWEQVLVGRAIVKVSQKSDSVLILGLPYHPAVEWYADCDVQFLGNSAVGKRPPGRNDTIAVMHGTNQFIAAGPFNDLPTESFRQETKQSLDGLGEYSHVARVDKILDHYRRTTSLR